MSLWANSNKKPTKSTSTINYKSSFSKRALKPLQRWEAGCDVAGGDITDDNIVECDVYSNKS
jgi:hypothetical protein